MQPGIQIVLPTAGSHFTAVPSINHDLNQFQNCDLSALEMDWTGLDYFLWVILQAASTIYYVGVLLGLLTETMVVWALWWAASFWRRLRLGLIDTWVSLRDTNHMSDDVFQWTNHVGSLAEWLAFQEWPLGTVLIRGAFPEETIGATNEWSHWAERCGKKCKCPPAGTVIHL